MRLLTTVAEQAEATTLGDALYADGVVTTIKETRDGGFAIWVHDDPPSVETSTSPPSGSNVGSAQSSKSWKCENESHASATFRRSMVGL